MSPFGHGSRTISILTGLQISIAVLWRAAAFDAPSRLLCDGLLGSSEHIWKENLSAYCSRGNAAVDVTDAPIRDAGFDGVVQISRRLRARIGHGKGRRVPAGFRAWGLMVPDGSMMRPLPIPLDIVWTGCTEYIPAVGEERAAGLAGSCSSSRRNHEQTNGARGALFAVARG